MTDSTPQSKKWNDFEDFSNNAQHFGSGGGLVTRGLGGRSTSIDAKQSTYSLLYIKMVATFSDELIDYCNNHGIDTSDDRLKKLLDKLENANTIKLDFVELHRIREQRNDIAHTPSFLIGKDEFSDDKKIIHSELMKLIS